MTQIVLAGTAPALLQQAGASGWALQNNGPGTLYLGNDASVSPRTGYSVVPGVALPLTANAVIYGCTDVNTSVSLALLQGATASGVTVVEANVPGAIDANITNSVVPVNGAVDAHITNASIPVSGTVNAAITNASIPVTGNVNAAITNASLAVTGTVNANIQNASIPVTGNVGISSGSVSISSGNVAVSSVGGTVLGAASAAPTLITTTSKAFTTAAQALTAVWSIGNIGLSSQLDVSKYSSLILAITQGYSSSVALAPGNYIAVDMYNVDAQVLSTVFAPIHAEWMLDSSMRHMIQVPVIANTAYIVLSLAKAATAFGGSLQISLYGSSDRIEKPRYVNQSPLLLGSCSVGGYYGKTVSAAGTTLDYISSRNGDAQLNIYGGGSVANLVPFAVQGGATTGLAALYTSTTPAVSGSTAPIYLPLLPVAVQTQLTSGSCAVSVTQK